MWPWRSLWPPASRDLFLAADTENPLGSRPGDRHQHVLVQPQWDVRTDAEACWVRSDGDGTPRSIALWQGRNLTVGDVTVVLRAEVEFIQIALADGKATVVAGDAAQLAEVRGLPQ